MKRRNINLQKNEVLVVFAPDGTELCSIRAMMQNENGVSSPCAVIRSSLFAQTFLDVSWPDLSEEGVHP